MSPLRTSSAAPLRIDTFPLPLFSQRSDRQAGPTVEGSQQPRSRILDIAVASGILALLVALLVPTLNSHDLTLPSATRGLVDHLRLARAGAASQGTHFRVTFQPHAYAIEQLHDGDGNGTWEPKENVPVWRVALPQSVAISSGTDTTIEFDSRGLITTGSPETSATPVIVELRDSQTEKSEVIEILPSGKVQRS